MSKVNPGVSVVLSEGRFLSNKSSNVSRETKTGLILFTVPSLLVGVPSSSYSRCCRREERRGVPVYDGCPRRTVSGDLTIKERS